MRGSRSQVFERLRQGTLAPGGSITFEPSPTELRKMMPRILGGTEAGASPYTCAVAETVPAFWIMVDRVAKVYQYNNCYVDKAHFRASEGQPLEVTLDIEALTETITAAATFTGGLTIDANPPFVFWDGVLTLASASIPVRSVEVTIDNMLKKDRFTNTQTRSAIAAMDRVVTIRAECPYTADTTALYDTAIGGVTADLTFTNGGKVFRLILQNVYFPARRSPVMSRKDDEVLISLEGQVFKTGSTAEVSSSVTP